MFILFSCMSSSLFCLYIVITIPSFYGFWHGASLHLHTFYGNVTRIYILVECLPLWGKHERTPPLNVVAVHSACDKITVVVLEEACLLQ